MTDEGSVCVRVTFSERVRLLANSLLDQSGSFFLPSKYPTVRNANDCGGSAVAEAPAFRLSVDIRS